MVSIHELRSYGYDDDAVRRHVRDGHLHPLYRAVYAVGHTNVTNEGLWLGAVKACGDGAVLGYCAAAALYRLLKWDDRLPEVIVAGQAAPKGVRTHRTNHLPITDTTRFQGMPVTTVERTLRDLASIVPYAQLRRAVREAQAPRLTTVGRLARALDARGPRRGRANLARILATGPAPTRSELEDAVLDLLLQAGLEPPDVNVPITAGGRRVAPDFRWPAKKLVVEADGAQWHEHPLARQDDSERQAILEADGERVIRVTWEQAVARRAQTIARIRPAYLHS